VKRYLLILLFFSLHPASSGQATGIIDLSGTWKVTWNEGGHGPQLLEQYLYSDPMLDPARYIDVTVPMEIHLALQKLGIIKDINHGTNTREARWVAEAYWQYTRRFTVPREVLQEKVWLVFDQVDLNAIIMLNGEKVGTHHSAFVPCRVDVTGKLRSGENLLQVAVESGLYGVAEKDGSAYQDKLGVVLDKRHWMRKPQYQFSWDWNPKLINVGITGPVRLEWSKSARVDQVSVQCTLTGDFQRAFLMVRSFIEGWEKEAMKMRTTVIETGETSLTDIELTPGITAFTNVVEINKPRLWWPSGQGDQCLYHLKVEVLKDNRVIASKDTRTGIRSIKIDQRPHPVKGSYFTIIINNREVFMKGGNWVPPDMIYSSVSRERLEKLTDIAIGANFNMLRIWGGATWAGHDLLDLCDEKGLLVWHDFLFACSKYPADDKDFYHQVVNEIKWGVREFSPHPSLAIWCGNNENEVGTFSWGWDQYGKMIPDYILYHHTIPLIMQQEDPSRPYWPSSPFSPGHDDPNNPFSGDQHPWNVSLGDAGPDFWEYREYVDRFPDEGGVLGASSPATLRQFLPAGEQYIRSFSWEHHDNEVNFWGFKPGINYRMTEFWLGQKAEDMGFEKYVLASGLLQAEGLQEYIYNYRRRMFSTSSAVFWMFNDSWPVTHGWSVVDYYLRKKLSYHPVRRAFEPVTPVVAIESDSVKIFGVNDSQAGWQGKVRFGICLLAGGMIMDISQDASIPANTSRLLASFPSSQWAKSDRSASCAFAILGQNGKWVAQHRLFAERFKHLGFEKPVIKIVRKDNSVTFFSGTFVWGACIDIDGEKEMPDNCFDLLPGIPYTVPWSGKEAPRVLFTGNSLFQAAL
jgi:beta-mannosidase